MSPHPGVDQERKEELILAKQLRACRVTILPKGPGDSDSHSPSPFTPSSSPPRDLLYNPFKPAHYPEEVNPTDWEMLKIKDPSNPPWASNIHTTTSDPALSREQTPGVVTKVPDIRKRVKQSPSINVLDFDQDSYSSASSPAPAPTRSSVRSDSLKTLSSVGAGSPSLAPRMPVPFAPSPLVSRPSHSSIPAPPPPPPSAKPNLPKLPVVHPQVQIDEEEPRPTAEHILPSTVRPLPFLAELQSLRRSNTPEVRMRRSEPPASPPPQQRLSSELPPQVSSTISKKSVTSPASQIPVPMPAHKETTSKKPAATLDRQTSASHPAAVERQASASHPSTLERQALASHPSTLERQASASHPSTLERQASASHPSTLERQSSGSQQTFKETPFPRTQPGTVERQSSVAAQCSVESTLDRGSSEGPVTQAIQDSSSRVPCSPTILRKKSVKDRSPSPNKTVTFNLPPKDREDPAPEPPPAQDPDHAKPPKSKKLAKNAIKINEKTNMSALAGSIIPQLNEMQKNFLGLLFFNELSQNIVDEMVAQQLSMMSGSKIRDVISVIDPQARESATRILMEEAGPAERASLVVDSLATMDSVEIAETILNISGYESVDVVKSMCEMGGRRFKISLIEELLASENLKLVPKRQGKEEPHMGSDGCDEVFDSCEESAESNQSQSR